MCFEFIPGLGDAAHDLSFSWRIFPCIAAVSYTHLSIYVSEAGLISINDRPYKMKNSKQFQEQLEAILKE